MPSSDPWDSPEMKEWMDSVRTGMIPKLAASSVSGALLTGSDPDIKQAVEIGYTLLLGKPLILLVRPGTHVPDGLAKAADKIVEFDLADPNASQRVQQAISELEAEGRFA